MCLFEVGNTILAYRISRASRYKSLDRIIIKRARITILLQISPLHRKRSFFLRIDTSSMQPITNTEFAIKKKMSPIGIPEESLAYVLPKFENPW